MEKVYLRDINFKKLKPIHGNYMESEIYHDNHVTYKIYKRNIHIWERKRKQKKIEDFCENKTNLPILEAKKQILFSQEKPIFLGIIMEYFDGCNLSTWIKNNNISSFLELEMEISKALQKIHEDERNIILGDLHFGNILINEKKDFRFCDFDGAHIGKRKADSHSLLLENFLRERKIPYKDSRKFDNISLLLMTYATIFQKTITDVTPYEYDERKEQILFLEHSKKYYKSLKEARKKAPFIPYLHEMK